MGLVFVATSAGCQSRGSECWRSIHRDRLRDHHGHDSRHRHLDRLGYCPGIAAGGDPDADWRTSRRDWYGNQPSVSAGNPADVHHAAAHHVICCYCKHHMKEQVSCGIEKKYEYAKAKIKSTKGLNVNENQPESAVHVVILIATSHSCHDLSSQVIRKQQSLVVHRGTT